MRRRATTGLPFVLGLALACGGTPPPAPPGPCLVLTPAALAFAGAEVACRRETLSVTIRNDCAQELSLVARTTPGSAFHLVSTPGSPVKPGAEARIEVSFRPASAGTAEALLQVQAEAAGGPELHEVRLSGSAAPLVLKEEAWVVPEAPARIDVVFVVDDGVTMRSWTESLRRNLEHVALGFAASGADVRLGVLSASLESGQYGRWRPTSSGAAWVDGPSRAEVLALAAPRGDQPGAASCLGALRFALQEGELTAFRRAGARLDLVCLTSQRESFPGALAPAFAQLCEALEDPWPSWRTSLSVVARFLDAPERCGEAGSLDDGRLRTLAALGGGVIEDLCTPSWSATLANVYPTHGWRTPGPFFLEATPDTARAPLECLVDDLALPPPGPATWSWNPVQNALVFSPVFVPMPGQVVRLRYASACP